MTVDRKQLREGLRDVVLESLRAGAPGLSDSTRQAIARSITLKAEGRVLPTILAQADSAERVAAVHAEDLIVPLARDLAREGGWPDPDAPWTENQAIIARGGAGAPVYQEYLDDARSLLGREALRSILSQNAGLSAEVEMLRAERDEALSHLPEGLRSASLVCGVRALAFSACTANDSRWRWGHAAQIGIAFADKAAGEEWEHGGMASVDACLAMAAILGCDCDSDEWQGMVKAGEARVAEHFAPLSTPGTDAPAAAQEGSE